MIYTIQGVIRAKTKDYVIIQTNGISFKIFANRRTLDKISLSKKKVELFCYLHLRENAIELYGVLREEELRFLELLNSISGIGPKTALAILDIANPKELAAAVKAGRADLLYRTPGIGRKTAERLVIELKSKIEAEDIFKTIERMEGDQDLLEALVSLGYKRKEAQLALNQASSKTGSLEDRLKEALKILSGHK